MLALNTGEQSFYLKTGTSSPPLQGSRGFSQLSLELSSSSGVWHPKKWKKMRENGKEKEKREKLEPFRAKSLFTGKKVSFTVYKNGLYSLQDKQNYRKQQKHLTVTRTKWGEIKRGTKRQNFKRAAGIQHGWMNSAHEA